MIIQINQKEQKEGASLRNFLENTRFIPFQFTDFSRVPESDQPTPDYAVKEKISIELTDLFLKTKRKYSHQQLEAAKLEILNGIRNEIERANLLPFEVRIHFREPHDPQKGFSIDKVTAALSKRIIDEIKAKNQDFERISINDLDLPEVFSVHMMNGTFLGRKWLNKTRVWEMPVYWIRRNPVEEIENRIKEKEKKLESYRDKYEQRYLLITTNRSKRAQAFEHTEELKDYLFKTRFDKVFIYDCSDNDAFELKNSNYNEKN